MVSLQVSTAADRALHERELERSNSLDPFGFVIAARRACISSDSSRLSRRAPWCWYPEPPRRDVAEGRSSLLNAVPGCQRTFADQCSALGRGLVSAHYALSRLSRDQLYKSFDYLRFARTFQALRTMYPRDGARVCNELVVEVALPVVQGQMTSGLTAGVPCNWRSDMKYGVWLVLASVL